MLKHNVYLFVFSAIVLSLSLSGCVTTGSGSDMASAAHMTKPANENLRKLKKIAVLVHLNKPQYYRDTTTSRLIEDNIIQIALEKGYRVPSRSDLVKVMEEINFQNSSLTSNSDAARIGKILNVPGVFIVHIAKLERSKSGRHYRNYATVSGRIINTETSEILWIKSVSGSENEQDASASDLIANLASQLASNL